MLSCVAIVIPYQIQADRSVTYWMQKRIGGDFDGLSEFPGGKLEPDESLVDCACREALEETGVQLSPVDLQHYTTISIALPHKTISMGIFLTKRIDLFDPSAKVTIKELSGLEQQLATLPANYQIIRDVHNYLLS